MKKGILILGLQILLAGAASAQDEGNKSSSASQSVKLVLSNSIDISYVNSNTESVMNFVNSNDWRNGVESNAQELKVRSNKSFKVAVNCDQSTFAYQGNSTEKPTSLPNEILWMKVVNNNTGGTLKGPFSNASYGAVSTLPKDVLVAGQKGGNQNFSVQYKCIPGFNLPAGTYSMDVVYTATQE